MVDLFVDWDVLARSRERLRSIEDLLSQPCRELAALPTEAVAQDDLRDKMQEFGDEWSYGIGKLGEYSGSAVEALEQIRDAFESLDDDLTKSIEGE